MEQPVAWMPRMTAVLWEEEWSQLNGLKEVLERALENP